MARMPVDFAEICQEEDSRLPGFQSSLEWRLDGASDELDRAGCEGVRYSRSDAPASPLPWQQPRHGLLAACLVYPHHWRYLAPQI
eukprot:scaffold8635_cov31-Prasinocladus_malaysianus.AAC.1